MRCTLILVLCFLACSLHSQSFDECATAYFISDVSDYCSSPGEFDTRDATGSVESNPSCWPEGTETNDIWISFIAPQQGALVQLTGLTNAQLGTLEQPSMVVYQGSCNALTAVGCSSVQEGQNNVIEINFNDLVIGQLYFLRVDGRDGATGNFRLCIRSFVPVPTPESDCFSSVVLCDKSSFFIENLGGAGDDQNEIGNTCITEEFASVWYSWTAATDGTLTFTLTPTNADDDLDFVVFHLPDGIRNCENRLVLRCMASGETVGAPPEQNLPCMGPTGLREESGDTQETLGCQLGDDNFLSPLNMTAGESYALIVNNYSRSGFGFRIDFGGTGTFLGPQPDFSIDASDDIACDKSITFQNQSTSQTDSIVGWSWNFGEGADPVLREGPGPHEVTYGSFGNKTTALTVESEKGCRVTKILDLEVGACCSDTSSLEILLAKTDLSCFESRDGTIVATGSGGSRGYRFGLSGQNVQPGSLFSNLSAGIYDVLVQDSKGCEAESTIQVSEPPELIVRITAAEDSVILGFGTNFFTEVFPLDRLPSYSWDPPDGLSCTDCPAPSVVPPGQTTYRVVVEDQDGCLAEDTYTLFTSLTRPLYAPTAVMPTSSRGNDRFRIYLNVAAELIESLSVYDRWGNQFYHVENVLPDDLLALGWDGRHNGVKVQSGVYVWAAKIRFIDGEVLNFAGEFTLFQ